MALPPYKKFDLKKQERKILAIFIIAVLLYTGFILFGDIEKFAQISANFNWGILPVLLILSFLNYVFRYLRWQYFLKKVGIEIERFESFKIFLAGLSMTITPGKTGELVKAYLINKKTGHKYSEVVPIVF